MRTRPHRSFMLCAALLAVPLFGDGLRAQDTTRKAVPDTITAGEAASEPPRRRLVKWNEYDGPLFTVRVGVGLLYDVGTFAQDDTGREQLGELKPGGQVRDSRFLLSGRIKTKRDITWSAGIMYDGPNDEWYVRQTGIMIGLPELKGHLFVGRSKEGISMNMAMVGYAGWTMERPPTVVAMVPLLADGVKWLGYLPEKKLLYNVGWYTDVLSEGQSFSSYDHQFVARVAWLPLMEDKGRLLHVSLGGRYGLVNNRTLRLRSRPEFNVAPFFVDTEPFGAKDTRMGQVEVYYRPGQWLFGLEYFVQGVDATDMPDPFFHGGDITASFLLTGETRDYNTAGGYFKGISPKRTVLEGGPGAWEAVLRFSYIDLDDGTITGGKLWRLTPMVNWHLTDFLRLEFAYGVARLDRFGLLGTTQFFQGRVQLNF